MEKKIFILMLIIFFVSGIFFLEKYFAGKGEAGPISQMKEIAGLFFSEKKEENVVEENIIEKDISEEEDVNIKLDLNKTIVMLERKRHGFMQERVVLVGKWERLFAKLSEINSSLMLEIKKYISLETSKWNDFKQGYSDEMPMDRDLMRVFSQRKKILMEFMQATRELKYENSLITNNFMATEGHLAENSKKMNVEFEALAEYPVITKDEIYTFIRVYKKTLQERNLLSDNLKINLQRLFKKYREIIIRINNLKAELGRVAESDLKELIIFYNESEREIKQLLKEVESVSSDIYQNLGINNSEEKRFVIKVIGQTKIDAGHLMEIMKEPEKEGKAGEKGTSAQ